jgi:hypothetical protein
VEAVGADLEIRITALYGPGTLLEDAAAARQTLQSLLFIKKGSEKQNVSELAAKHFSAPQAIAPELPENYARAHPEQGQAYEALTVRFPLPKEAIAFAMPERSPHDLLLYCVEKGVPSQYYLLIPKDETRPMVFPSAKSASASSGKLWLGWSCIALGFLLALRIVSSSFKPRSAP